MSLKLIDFLTYPTEKANLLWDNVRKLEHCFDDFSRHRGDMFAARLASPSTVAFEVENAGLVTIENIIPLLNGNMHFFSWKAMPEKEMVDIGKEVISYAFSTYNLARISAMPPDFNVKAAGLAIKLGFKYEGRLRDYMLFDNRYRDVFMYGLTRDDWKVG